jgi:hypothetical protein
MRWHGTNARVFLLVAAAWHRRIVGMDMSLQELLASFSNEFCPMNAADLVASALLTLQRTRGDIESYTSHFMELASIVPEQVL